MRWLLRVLVGAALAGAAVLGTPGAAQAGDGGLTVTVRADDPLAPVVVLANSGPPCQVAITSLGTVTVTDIEQGGAPVTPVVFEPGFTEPLDVAIAGRLRTLDPGTSIELRLPVVKLGPTGHALESVSYTGTTASSGLFYPVRAGQPLHLQVSYTVPVQPHAGPPLCGPETLDAAAQPSPSLSAPIESAPGPVKRSWLLWIAIPVAALLLLVGLVLLIGSRAGRTGAAVVIALAALLAPGWDPRPASAAFQLNDPGLQTAFDNCLRTLHQPGHDPAGILPTLERPDIQVLLETPTDGVTHEGGASRNLMVIFWNPDDRHSYVGSGGVADPCTSLYHEMYHAWEDSQGTQDHHECITTDGHHTGIGINEVAATRAQNRLRHALGLGERDHYGDRPLPAGDCLPAQPGDPVCTDRGCGGTRGEPHLTTFDGRRYDFQAVGEFVAARDPAGGFAIQVRQQPYGESKVIAVNTSIATDINGDRVQVDLTPAGLTALVNGAARDGDRVDLDKGGQLRLGSADAGPLATVSWPDGSTAWVSAVPGVGLNLSVQPAPGRGGHLEGLLGNDDGKADNDIRPRGGNPVTGTGQPPYAALYPGFADSWRVEAKASLFTYPPGKGTESYTRRGFPQQTVTAAGLPDRAAAEAVCRHYGVTDRELLEACILDVGLTGQAGFAAAARAAQFFETGVRAGQPAPLPATADIYLAGAAPVPSLPGGAGTLPMRVAIDPASTHQVSFPEVRGVIGPWAANHDGPDGGTEFSGTDITPFNGISGVLHKTRSLFLVGVFLPKPPLPSATDSKPDLSDRDTVVEVKPVLGEVFYVGDGHTPDGTVQRFVVPAGAANLYVGFADASLFRGGPGFYGDNTGALTVRVATG